MNSNHQIYAGGDWEVAPSFKINMGLGFDLRGTGVVLKSRFEWSGDYLPVSARPRTRFAIPSDDPAARMPFRGAV